jgi:hypothetical protein
MNNLVLQWNVSTFLSRMSSLRKPKAFTNSVAPKRPTHTAGLLPSEKISFSFVESF